MSLSLHLDPHSPTPTSEQLRQQLRGHILAGALPEHTRLPSVRQLAGDLDVAPGTVAKAYAALEAEGLVVSSRGRGTRVAPGQSVPDAVHRAALAYVAAARSSGIDLDEATAAVTRAWHAER
ncbi:GntR family transcriptional regulator [Propionibacteriaceae bacterium Y1923]|uniref:GntR family transcriptional regulator n=1 Tax=Aestuariimicrobium sp. Y1814 TaxID=3418742 RepID=UPI003C2499AA